MMAEQLPLVPTTKSTFRLPAELHHRLKIRAVQEKRPIADLLIDAIEFYLSREETGHHAGTSTAGI
jgi:predicted DNA-binding protein